MNSQLLTNDSFLNLLLLAIHLYSIVLNAIQVVLADGLGSTLEDVEEWSAIDRKLG